MARLSCSPLKAFKQTPQAVANIETSAKVSNIYRDQGAGVQQTGTS